jgi:plastocyanin
MTPERIVLATFLVLGLSVSARAETIQITIDKLVFAPVEVNAKVGDTIEWINKDALVHTATATSGDWNVNIAPKQTELNRLLLQVSSQYEGPRDRRAVRCC